jgi:histidinol-phosphate phosphatase family protein
MKPITIVHISDFHLRRALPGTSSVSRRASRLVPDLLAEAVAAIRAASPDLVAVTGDLVDHPFYAMADGCLDAAGEADLRLARELLAPFTCPVVALPGNHDHPGLFARVFADAPRDLDVGGWRVLAFHDGEADFHRPQRLGDERDRWLAALADGDPRPQVHLQHYLVSPDRNDGYPHTYREAESLRQALRADGRVRLVLSGHYHRGERLFRDAGVAYAVAPAFAEPPHPYRLYRLSDAAIEESETALRPAATRARRKAVFLDRDGTINPQASYRTGPGPFCLLDGAAAAMRSLRDAGYAIVIVSNQTAVGRGWITVEQVAQTNDKMAALLAPHGAAIDGVYCRYEAEDAVIPEYRWPRPLTKPDPTMLHEAAADLGLDLAASFMVGDRATDVDAGRNAGCRASVLVRTGLGRDAEREGAAADHVADDLAAAARWILGRG